MNKTEILLNEENDAILFVNGYELVNMGSATDKTPQQLEELKEEYLKKYGIVEKTEVITKDKEFMVDQNVDLQLVRATMRKLMRELTSNNISMEEKRNNLGYYNTITSQAKTIISACLVEIAIEKARPKQIETYTKK